MSTMTSTNLTAATNSSSNNLVSAKQQILRAKEEAQTSLANARLLSDQWLAANCGSNPIGLTQKDIDLTTKTFKNRLLTVKWDCEDLEELVSVNSNEFLLNKQDQDLNEVKIFIENCRQELSKFSNQLEQFELNRKLYQKHGIQTQSAATTTTTLQSSNNNNNTNLAQSVASAVVTSIIQNPLQNHEIHYKRLSNENTNNNENLVNNNDDNGDEIDRINKRPNLNCNANIIVTSRLNGNKSSSNIEDGEGEESEGGGQNLNNGEIKYFDKNQLIESTINSNANIFNNAVYEHFEHDNNNGKLLNNNNGVSATQVFGNLTRPQNSDIYMDSNNENEMILQMLETEYYNPPNGLLGGKSSATMALAARYNQALGKLFNNEFNKFWTIILSLPFLVILFFIVI